MTSDGWIWGAADEAGTLNRIGPAEVKRAATLVCDGVVISLAQPLGKRTAVPPHRPGVQHFMDRDGGDYAAGARQPGGFQFAEDTLLLPLHVGTHVDALCHVWCQDRLYNGFPGSGTRSTTGAMKLGVDKMPPSVTRGVLLDFVKLRGGPLPDGAAIDAAEVERAFAAAGTTPQPGDAILMRTGWLERQQSGAPISFNDEPGIETSAARLFSAAGIGLLGADNYAIEVLPFAKGTIFPVHQHLIRDHGMPLLEGLSLAALAAQATRPFMFAMAPLPIEGGTASPVAPMAIL